MPAESSPPLKHTSGRATNRWQHRGEARRNFATSKDVMPTQAGYTSGFFRLLCKQRLRS